MEEKKDETLLNPEEYLVEAKAKIDSESASDRDTALTKVIEYNATLDEAKKKAFFPELVVFFHKMMGRLAVWDDVEFLELVEELLLEFFEMRKGYQVELDAAEKREAADADLLAKFVQAFKDLSDHRKWELRQYLASADFEKFYDFEFGNGAVLEFLINNPRLGERFSFVTQELKYEDAQGKPIEKIRPFLEKALTEIKAPKEEPERPRKPDYTQFLSEEEKKLYPTEIEYKKARAAANIEAEFAKGKESFLNFLRGFQSIKSFLREKDPAKPDIAKFITYFETKRKNDEVGTNELIVERLKKLN